tara:strand:+ start:236 stop:496 length:261 start_codon:yes stop_codon:yes gene_type:complete
MYKLILSIFLIVLPTSSFAYLGPGMGGGILAATVGIVIAIFAALFGILWFPIKRLIKKKKTQQEEHQKIRDYAESINEETRNNKEK